MIKKILIVIGSILASLAAGGIGSLATTSNIPTWYATLDKPLLTPPNWIFGPVWTSLYIA
ncbi:MAG: TspO/MBR family protein, partial [Candidatus Microsaccharimonas sp.]